MHYTRTILALLAIVGVLAMVGSVAATTDYVYVRVNGDTSGVTMTQGDMLGWGSNCAVGATMHWIIAVDLNDDSTFDAANDLIVAQFNATDGVAGSDDDDGDADGIANGLYQSEDFPAGVAPGYYIFRCTDLTDSTWAERGVTVLPLSLPPNMITGDVTIPGVTAPDPLLENIWVEAELDSDTADGFWSGLTNDLGHYVINIGAIGTGLEHSVEVVNVAGYVAPGAQAVTAAGVVSGIDFAYLAPADSVYGMIEDQFGTPLSLFLETFAWQNSGSTSRFVETSDGSFAVYFLASELGDWRIGVSSRGLLPDYMVPRELEFDYQGSSAMHTFVCYAADSAIYGRVTENGAAPTSSYRLHAISDSLGSSSQAVAAFSTGGTFELPVTTVDPTGWRVSLVDFDEDYPIPLGLVLEGSNPVNVAPGDTVILNLIAGHLVQDSLRLDPGDPTPNWEQVWVTLQDGVRNYSDSPDSTGVFTVYADTGTYNVNVGADNYLAEPSNRTLTVSGDTIGGLQFTLNRAHSRVSGILTNVVLPLTSPVWVDAETDVYPNGYRTSVQVDTATGTFELWLCDGDWTLRAPFVTGYDTPADSSFTVGESPDTARTVNLEYSVPVGIGGDEGLRPGDFTLHQNFPNPFNMSTRIEFSLEQPGNVTLEIFDLLGRSVTTLVAGLMPAGNNSFIWNGRDARGTELASGVYFYRIQMGDRSHTRKLVLLK